MSSELFHSEKPAGVSEFSCLERSDSWIFAIPDNADEIHFDEDGPEYDPRYFTEPVYRIHGRAIALRRSPNDPIDPEVMAFFKSITPLVQMEPHILGGMPVFKDTMVPLKRMFDYLLARRPLEEFLRDFPSVPAATARAVLENDATLFYEAISKTLEP